MRYLRLPASLQFPAQLLDEVLIATINIAWGNNFLLGIVPHLYEIKASLRISIFLMVAKTMDEGNNRG